MIFIGYPGIGKSTLVKKQSEYLKSTASYMIFIDLESSYFHNPEENRPWADKYCNVAVDLHKQGFCVFTSCHNIVRDHFHTLVTEGKILHNQIGLVYPSLDLYDEWIEMLENRYANTGLEKDQRALDTAREHFKEHIEDLRKDSFNKIEIFRVPTDPNYDLRSIINRQIRETKQYIITEE